MDSLHKPELPGVSPPRLSPCRLTPNPLYSEAQVVAANPIQYSDYLTQDGQALLRSPTHGVSNDQFTGGTSDQYSSELNTMSRPELANKQNNIVDALPARSGSEHDVAQPLSDR